MTIFIYNFKKNESSKGLKDFNFIDYLPRPELEKKYKSIHNSEIITFKYNSALDKPLIDFNDGFLFVQGYLSNRKIKNLYEFLNSDKPANLVDFSESFCAISAKGNSFSFMSSVTGTDQLFYIETNENFFVTNRHNLLGALSLPLTLRKKSFCWMAGRTHIGDNGTYWKEIKRSLPSRHYIYNQGLKCVKPNYQNLFTKIKDSEVIDYFDSTVPYFKDIFSEFIFDKPSRK